MKTRETIVKEFLIDQDFEPEISVEEIIKEGVMICTNCGQVFQVYVPGELEYIDEASPCCRKPYIEGMANFIKNPIWLARFFGVAEDFNCEEK